MGELEEVDELEDAAGIGVPSVYEGEAEAGVTSSEPESMPEPEPEPEYVPAPEPEGLAEAPEAEAGPAPAAISWFAPDSVWNRELSPGTPLAEDSSAYVAELVRQVESAGAWINSEEFSTPVYVVPADEPRVKVRMVSPSGNEIDPALVKAMESVPLPSDARPALGTDHHLVVLQPSTEEMWEFWKLEREGSSWIAGYGGAMDRVATNPGYYDGSAWPGAHTYWGATATSLPLLGGLMTIEELRRHRIGHALALAIPEPSPSFVWPAQRSDGGNRAADAIPEGTIFRLPAAVDLSSLGLGPIALAIAEAAQDYGMIVRDTSGCVCLYGEAPTAGKTGIYTSLLASRSPREILANFPWSRLQVVEPGS